MQLDELIGIKGAMLHVRQAMVLKPLGDEWFLVFKRDILGREFADEREDMRYQGLLDRCSHGDGQEDHREGDQEKVQRGDQGGDQRGEQRGDKAGPEAEDIWTWEPIIRKLTASHGKVSILSDQERNTLIQHFAYDYSLASEPPRYLELALRYHVLGAAFCTEEHRREYIVWVDDKCATERAESTIAGMEEEEDGQQSGRMSQVSPRVVRGYGGGREMMTTQRSGGAGRLDVQTLEDLHVPVARGTRQWVDRLSTMVESDDSSRGSIVGLGLGCQQGTRQKDSVQHGSNSRHHQQQQQQQQQQGLRSQRDHHQEQRNDHLGQQDCQSRIPRCTSNPLIRRLEAEYDDLTVAASKKLAEAGEEVMREIIRRRLQ